MLKHGWNSLDNYLSVHEKTLRFYEKYMETVRTYSREVYSEYFQSIKCHGIFFYSYRGARMRVDLEKDIEIDPSNKNRLRARTHWYSYSATFPGRGPAIRYCSPHGEWEEEGSAPHHNRHHKHDYRKNPKGDITLLGGDEWPHVGEFIEEVLSSF